MGLEMWGVQAGGDLAPPSHPGPQRVAQAGMFPAQALLKDRAGQRPCSDGERQPGLGRACLREGLVLLLLLREED